jgi:type IV secretion system protein VirD4
VVDPLQIVGGRDRWDPLGSVDPADVFRLRRIAQALLPSSEGESDNSEYFKNGAGALIVGALIGAKRRGKGLIAAADFIDNVDAFKQALSGATDRASRRALSILEFEPRVRDPLLSTATQAFAWLDDSRVEGVVSGSSFDLSDVARGEADLFVVIPPEDSKTLAPLMRLLLSELFVAVRRHRPPERILVFIDEAASLGKFHEIVSASAELPGHGASLWTFWQNRAQMVETYGEQGAASLLATAEFVTISDISSVDPDELERFSRALGNFTQLVESKSEGSSGGEKPSRQNSSSRSPQPVRLMTPEALKTMPSDQLILLPNSKLYAKHPVKLTKLQSYADPEFAPFIEDTNPVRAAG